MRKAHLTPETLRHYLSRDHDEIENALLLHHLAVCPDCAEVGGYLLDLYRGGELDLRFCIVEAELARSRTEAPVLLAELLALGPEEVEARVRGEARFQSWGLVEALCLESSRTTPEDPGRALAQARLASDVAGRLADWQPADHAWLAELRAYAWSHVANALRVVGDLPSAHAALLEADRQWAEGFLDVGCDVMGYLPKILAFKATLRLEERRCEEALALYEEALRADARNEVRTEILVGMARAHEISGALDRALAVLERAEREAGEIPPRLRLCIRHNTLWVLSAGGEVEAAAALLPEVAALAERCGGEIDRLRLRWAAARIEAGRGRPEALDLYEEVRQGFLQRRIGYDTALVTLEQAVLHRERGDLARVRSLARDLIAVFAAQDVHREALAALALFVQASEREDLSAAYLLRLGTYLREARYDPQRHFEG